MAGLLLGRLALRRVLPAVRLVSTSNKNNDTATVGKATATEAASKTEKDWVSYGFEFKSKADDRTVMNAIMFASVTLCLVVVGFYWTYLPDYRTTDWAQREAYLELRRRERDGRPRIDPNFIDPARIVLPSDEELGDTEIVV